MKPAFAKQKKRYVFVNQKDGYTAYRRKEKRVDVPRPQNPRDELVVDDSTGKVVSTNISEIWQTL